MIKVESANDVAEKVVAAPAADIQETQEVETKEVDDQTEEESVAQEAEAEESDDDQEQVEDKPKKKSGFARKLAKKDELLAEKDREIERLRAEKAPRAEPEKVADEGEPDPDNFDNHRDYVKAVTKWTLEQDRKELTKKQQIESAQAAHKQMMDSFKEKKDAYADEHEDFDTLIKAASQPKYFLKEEGQLAILGSDLAPEIMHELAKNLPELERISKLSPIQQVKEIGKVEARLTKEETKEKKEVKQTNAPAPIKPVGSKASGVVKSIYSENLSQKEYEAIRAKQQAQKRA